MVIPVDKSGQTGDLSAGNPDHPVLIKSWENYSNAIVWLIDVSPSSDHTNASIGVTFLPAEQTVTAGPPVYKLVGAPVSNLAAKPTADGVSAAVDVGSATYSHPDTAVGRATRTISWDVLPSEINPGVTYGIKFRSVISVARAAEVDQGGILIPGTTKMSPSVQTYATILVDPYFRVSIDFGGPGSGPQGSLFQVSPDGLAWKQALQSPKDWENALQSVSPQVVRASNGIWANQVQKYTPRTPGRAMPLETPAVESQLEFRLQPGLQGPWPDKLFVTVAAEATGIPGGGGHSVGTVVYTYQRQ